MEINDALVNTMVKWTQSEQEDAIKKMKDDEDMLRNGMFNLDNWIQHGGTYQDTPPAALLRRFLDDERFPNAGYFAGSMEIDRTTENDISGGGLEQIEEEVSEAVQDFNRRTNALKVRDTGIDIDNEDGNFVIPVKAFMIINIPEREFVQSAYHSKARAGIESLGDLLSDYLPVSQDLDVSYRADRGLVEIMLPIDVESVHSTAGGFGGNFAFGVDNFRDILTSLERIDDDHEQFVAGVREALVNEGVLQGTPIQEFAKMYNDNTYYEWEAEMFDDRSNPTQIDIETRQYVNLEDLIKKIPVTLDRSYTPGGLNAFIPVMFDGKEIAEAYRVYDNQDLEETNVIGYEVISGEFGNRKSEELPDLKAVISYAQRQIAKMLVTYRTIGGVSQASRDYHIAVREELRKATGLRGEYHYPPSVLYGSGPDSDDEYNMRYQIQLTDNSNEGQLDAAEKIVNNVDDEDELKEIFRRAFAKAAKVPVATNENVRDYFKKFDIFG